jgi:hypothetical protein
MSLTNYYTMNGRIIGEQAKEQGRVYWMSNSTDADITTLLWDGDEYLQERS